MPHKEPSTPRIKVPVADYDAHGTCSRTLGTYEGLDTLGWRTLSGLPRPTESKEWVAVTATTSSPEEGSRAILGHTQANCFLGS